MLPCQYLIFMILVNMPTSHVPPNFTPFTLPPHFPRVLLKSNPHTEIYCWTVIKGKHAIATVVSYLQTNNNINTIIYLKVWITFIESVIFYMFTNALVVTCPSEVCHRRARIKGTIVIMAK